MSKKIIIADDNPLMREAYVALIRDNVADVVIDEVGDGKTLVEKVRQGQYDFVLADITMGGINATRQIREFNKEVPIAWITGGIDGPDSYSRAAQRQGAYYIVKGRDENKLVTLLKNI